MLRLEWVSGVAIIKKEDVSRGITNKYKTSKAYSILHKRHITVLLSKNTLLFGESVRMIQNIYHIYDYGHFTDDSNRNETEAMPLFNGGYKKLPHLHSRVFQAGYF